MVLAINKVVEPKSDTSKKKLKINIKNLFYFMQVN